jgi:hypothetical protein
MRRRVILLALILVFCVVGFLLRRDDFSRQVLPDGTVLVLSGWKVGRTNIYSHGTGLSKALGRFAPSNAISVFGMKLQRPQVVRMPGPEGGELLTAELSIGAGSPRERSLVSPPFYRKHRLLISGDDDKGFTFVKELNEFKSQPDGLFSLVWAWSYPRDSRRLHFRLEERQTNNTRDWSELTTFVMKNPKPVRAEAWRLERSPRFKLADGLEVEVGELEVRHEPIHPTDIWEYTAFLPVRILRNGQMATNWGIQDGKVWDATGNYDSFSYGFTKTVTNDWTTYRMHRPLDPAKVWKFQLNFARDSDFPATNLFSFTVPWPLSGAIQTNFGGSPIQIDFVNTDMLSVQLTNKPVRLRVTFIKAVDDEGTDLDGRVGSWGQHGFWKGLKSARTPTPKPVQVHATVAIHENYHAEFMLQPRFEKQSKP